VRISVAIVALPRRRLTRPKSRQGLGQTLNCCKVVSHKFDLVEVQLLLHRTQQDRHTANFALYWRRSWVV